MVYIDPMSPEPVQIVRGHPATKKKNFFRKVPPWVKDLRNASLAQLKSMKALTGFAKEKCRGKYGTVTLPDGRRVPRPAFIVMTEYPHRGVGAFGGKSKEERLRERHAITDKYTIPRLEKLIEEKEAAARAGVATAVARAFE